MWSSLCWGVVLCVWSVRAGGEGRGDAPCVVVLVADLVVVVVVVLGPRPVELCCCVLCTPPLLYFANKK